MTIREKPSFMAPFRKAQGQMIPAGWQGRWLKNSFFGAVLLLIFSFVWGDLVDPHTAEAQGGRGFYYSFGEAKIRDENLAAAKTHAISRALRKAVEDFIVSRLSPDPVAQNLERIAQDLFPGASKLVENFHVLGETSLEDTYLVLVKVKINQEVAERILEQTGLLQQEGPTIKVLFMVLEDRDGLVSCWWKEPGTSPALTATELALITVFQDLGYRVVNRISQMPDTEFAPALRAVELKRDAVHRWGELFSADLVIYGKSMLYRGQEAVVTLKAYSLRHGKVICDGSQAQFLDPDMDPEKLVGFLEEIIRRLTSRLGACIERNLEPMRKALQGIQVNLQGLRNYIDYRKFLEFLRTQIPGVSEVKQSRLGRGYVSLKVKFKGRVDTFVAAVMGHELLPLHVVRVEQNAQDVTFHLGP